MTFYISTELISQGSIPAINKKYNTYIIFHEHDTNYDRLPFYFDKKRSLQINKNGDGSTMSTCYRCYQSLNYFTNKPLKLTIFEKSKLITSSLTDSALRKSTTSSSTPTPTESIISKYFCSLQKYYNNNLVKIECPDFEYEDEGFNLFFCEFATTGEESNGMIEETMMTMTMESNKQHNNNNNNNKQQHHQEQQEQEQEQLLNEPPILQLYYSSNSKQKLKEENIFIRYILLMKNQHIMLKNSSMSNMMLEKELPLMFEELKKNGEEKGIINKEEEKVDDDEKEKGKDEKNYLTNNPTPTSTSLLNKISETSSHNEEESKEDTGEGEISKIKSIPSSESINQNQLHNKIEYKYRVPCAITPEYEGYSLLYCLDSNILLKMNNKVISKLIMQLFWLFVRGGGVDDFIPSLENIILDLNFKGNLEESKIYFDYANPVGLELIDTCKRIKRINDLERIEEIIKKSSQQKIETTPPPTQQKTPTQTPTETPTQTPTQNPNPTPTRTSRIKRTNFEPDQNLIKQQTQQAEELKQKEITHTKEIEPFASLFWFESLYEKSKYTYQTTKTFENNPKPITIEESIIIYEYGLNKLRQFVSLMFMLVCRRNVVPNLNETEMKKINNLPQSVINSNRNVYKELLLENTENKKRIKQYELDMNLQPNILLKLFYNILVEDSDGENVCIKDVDGENVLMKDVDGDCLWDKIYENIFVSKDKLAAYKERLANSLLLQNLKVYLTPSKQYCKEKKLLPGGLLYYSVLFDIDLPYFYNTVNVGNVGNGCGGFWMDCLETIKIFNEEQHHHQEQLNQKVIIIINRIKNLILKKDEYEIKKRLNNYLSTETTEQQEEFFKVDDDDVDVVNNNDVTKTEEEEQEEEFVKDNDNVINYEKEEQFIKNKIKIDKEIEKEIVKSEIEINNKTLLSKEILEKNYSHSHSLNHEQSDHEQNKYFNSRDKILEILEEYEEHYTVTSHKWELLNINNFNEIRRNLQKEFNLDEYLLK